MDGVEIVNNAGAAEDVILINPEPEMPEVLATANNGLSKADNILNTLKKLRIIVEINPWSFKENTKEAGALWREVVDMCKANAVTMNYETAKKPAHSLQELVSRSIQAFKKKYPLKPPTGEAEDTWSEKDKLVFQIIKYKENLRAGMIAGKSAVADRKEGAGYREKVRQAYRVACSKKTVKGNTEEAAKELPEDSPMSAVEAFDPEFEITRLAETDADGKLLGAVNNDGDPDETKVNDATVIGDIAFPAKRTRKRDESGDANGLILKRNKAEDQVTVLATVVTALQNSKEIERDRNREEKDGREAAEKFQREEAEKDRALKLTEAEKDRAHQLEMAKLAQDTDLQKFKMMLEFTKK